MLAGAKQWYCPEPRPGLTEVICRELSLLPPVARALVNRGISTPEEAEFFLNPSLEDMHSPFEMKGMTGAVHRLVRALENNEFILVYGDYDADGVTAAALLTSALKRLGGRVSYFLPSRFKEGYGLQRDVLEKYKEKGCSLLITVDCGINAAEEVGYCRENGMDVIVTDHHYPLVKLHGATAVINPLQSGCSYPCKYLAGVGIAFKLVCALLDKTGYSLDPFDYLDMVALGTIADIVPLKDENRVITVYGLEKINRNPNPGLKALIDGAGLAGKTLSSRDLAFGLAPSVNAAGRMGEAYPAANLLMAAEEGEAVQLAGFLIKENQSRRTLESDVFARARQIIDEQYNGEPGDVIVLWEEGWHPGVIGIVASKIVDLYYRPAVIVALEGEEGKGSARSIPGFDITEALGKCGDLLERFGGHEQAAGITVKRSNLDRLREKLNVFFRNRLKPEDLLPRINLDGELMGPEIDHELARQLEMLAPFGAGNEYPRFYTRGWQVRGLRLVGRDRNHLKLSLNKNNKLVEPIFFSGNSYINKIMPGREIDMVVTLKNGTWQERPVLNVEISDISLCDGMEIDDIEIVDRRKKKNKKTILKGILDYTGEPIIYIGKTGQEAAIKKELHKAAGARFVHPGSGEHSAGVMEPKENRDIVLFHLPLLPEYMERVIGMCAESAKLRIYLLYNEEDKLFNERIMKATLPSPDNIKEVFSLLKELSEEKGFFPEDGFHDLSQHVSFTLTKNMRGRCINILQETGLVKPVSGGWHIKNNGVPSDSELAVTGTFRESRELEKKCFDFQKYLLETDPESLCLYIKRIHIEKTAGTEENSDG